jgi:hypothetical protein
MNLLTNFLTLSTKTGNVYYAAVAFLDKYIIFTSGKRLFNGKHNKQMK